MADDLRCNDVRVRAGTLTLRRRAGWLATLELESETAPAEGDAVTLRSGASAYVGTVERAGVDRGAVAQVRVVGGAGGLTAILPPRSYRGSASTGPLTVRTVLEGIAEDAGETLSGDIADALLDTELPAWVRPRLRTTLALDALGEALGAAWRVRADGTLWMGAETWDTVDVASLVLAEVPQLRQRTLALESYDATLAPGTTYQGTKVDCVAWSVGPRPVAVLCAPLDGGNTLDDDFSDRDVGIKARAAVVEIYALGVHRARVVQQRSDGSLDLEPEGDASTRMWAGMESVPVRYTVPGLSMTLPAAPDALVAVFGFENADPRRPVVLGFEARPGAQGTVEWRTQNEAGHVASIKLLAGGRIEVTTTGDDVVFNGGTARISRVGDATQGHVHTATFSGTANLATGTVTGTVTIASAVDHMAEGAPHVKA